MNLLKEFSYLYKKSEATDKISVTVIQAYYDDVKQIGYIYNIHGYTDPLKLVRVLQKYVRLTGDSNNQNQQEQKPREVILSCYLKAQG